MFCRNCGKELIGSPEFCPNCGFRPLTGTRFCTNCGAQTALLTEICTKCGAPVAGKAGVVGRTWKPTTAGILAIIAGALNLLVGIGLAAADVALLPLIGFPVLGPLAVVLIVLGIVSVVGGIFALQRRIWGMALAGAICALFPPPVIILGILAIVFVAMGKGEFK